jgi:outer membrane protein TolC
MKTLMTIVFSLLALPAWSRDLSLDQALDMAQQHSLILQKALAQSEGATAEYRAARAERFPTLSAAGNANYISEVSLLNIQLPTGQTLEGEMGVHENYQADFRLTLPLYSGGRISGGIDLARASREMYAALESTDRDRVAYQTRVEYFGMYRATELLQVAQASFKRAEIINNNVHSLYDGGAADSVALLDASLALSRATLGISQAETNRRTSEIRLQTLLGAPLTESLALTTTPPQPTRGEVDATISGQKPELRAAEASVQMATARLRVSKADHFPAVAAFGGYSYGKPNLDRFGDTWNDYYTVGATLNWSFNLGGKAVNRTRAASHTLDASRRDRDQVLESLSREANLAVEQLRLAYTRYQNSLVEYRISADHFRLAQGQHSDGVLSSNRLLEIEADLTAAEASLAASLVDYYIAQSAYYYTTGSDSLKKGI